MTTLLAPRSEEDIVEIVRDARSPLAIRGGGTRSGLARPIDADTVLCTSAVAGITHYEPAEMIISVRAGTPVAVVEQALERHGQMLPFEPMDHRTLYGTVGEPRFGAIAAGNISGPRRIQAGAARDSILGIRFVNGRGQAIKSGGRVMKNVTGLDLVKLSCGAYGSLGILTEITVRVLPRPERSATLVLSDLSDRDGVAALAAAATSPYEVSGAAHVPRGNGTGRASTLVRVEGFASSVEERLGALTKLFAGAEAHVIDGEESRHVWHAVRDASSLAHAENAAVWRVSVKPTHGPAFVEALSGVEIKQHFYDWSGGLVWLAVPQSGGCNAPEIRAAVRALGGHATLVRGAVETRRTVDVFQPLSLPLMDLTRKIKESVDPRRLINPSVMYRGI